jgi:hypothetical protein
VPFLRRMDAKTRGREIDLTLLRAVHLFTLRDRKQAIDAARNGYGAPPEDGPARPRRGPPAKKERHGKPKTSADGGSGPDHQGDSTNDEAA